jgi:TolB-like protein/Tfp pilus assembly protein PilF
MMPSERHPTPAPDDAPAALPGLTVAEVRTELDRILLSRALANTPAQRDFLRFVVEETLAGRGPELKEYVIAVRVLGRPESFDPRADAAVRVAARRLRQKIADFYATDGHDDPVSITLRPGSYLPDIARRRNEQRVQSTPDANTGTPAVGSRRRRLWWWPAAAVLAIVAVAAFWLTVGRQAATRAGPTIAVLPFTNATADAGTDYICFGVVEDLTTALTTVPGIRVIARTSASQFTKGMDVAEIGRRLGAALLVEGSVRRDGSRLVVTAQLIETKKGTHLWAASYQREASDGVAAQQQVARTIATAVEEKLGLASPQPAPERHVSTDAVELYWKGRYARARRDPSDFEQARSYFEQAVSRAPDYADAHAALGEVLVIMAFDQAAPPIAMVERARASLERALAVDPRCYQAVWSLAWLRFVYDHDWPRAREGFERSIAINPSAGSAHNVFALALMAHGQLDEALEHSRLAVALDPVRYAASNDNAVVLCFAKRYDEAIAACNRTLEAAPEHQSARIARAMAYIGKAAYPQAIADLEAARKAFGPVSAILGRLGYVSAVSGDRTKALALLQEMAALDAKSELAYVHRAQVYAGLGDHAAAIANLERAEMRHETDLSFVGMDLAFDGLRRQPRFVALLDRLGLRAR